MRRSVIVGVVSGHVVVIGVDGVTAAIRRFIDGWNDRCEPFTLDQARRRDPRQSRPQGNFINVTLATLASILTSLFLLAGGCNLCSGCCCTDQVQHTERIDLYAFNRAASAD
jgi:hypothetical protein